MSSAGSMSLLMYMCRVSSVCTAVMSSPEVTELVILWVLMLGCCLV